MSDIVIAAERLSKSYLVGHQSAERESYIALRDLIARHVDAALLEAIAREYRIGRRLYIVTTNVDAQRTAIWDMGKIAASGDPAHVAMPRAHRVSSLLKRWLLGTHQGAARPHQLDFYLDEFAFRFNRRSSQRRGLLFYRLLEQAIQVDPAPVATIVGGRP